MATYDPPQPLWKRNVAALSDFLLAAILFGYPLGKLPGNQPGAFASNPGVHEVWGLSGWPLLILIVLIVAYYVVLGRTGGTVFQRLLGMKRAR
jgi:hypothetical protein